MIELTKHLRFGAVGSAFFVLSAISISMMAQSSQAQQLPPRQRAGAEVISVQLRPVKRRVGEPCPADMTFYGAITTNGPTTVEYTWLSSGGRSWPKKTLKFTAAGPQSVSESWKLGKPGQKVDVWIQIQVLSPNRMLSTKVTESFTCGK